MVVSIFGKLAGALASIPEPILGGMALVGLGEYEIYYDVTGHFRELESHIISIIVLDKKVSKGTSVWLLRSARLVKIWGLNFHSGTQGWCLRPLYPLI